MEQHRPTEKVLDILELLMTSNEGYNLSEISNKLSIPKGSLFPVIHTLCDRKFVKHNGVTQKYSLGYKCYEVGNSYISNINVNEEIRNIVQKMAIGCGETCHFAVLDEKEVLYLFKEESPEPIRMISSAGKRIPAHATAIGKALLSKYTEEELRQMYSDGLKQLTEHTITDIDVLISQINKIRTEQFAYETEESSQNVTCIAVPIEKDGQVVAALSAAVLIFRATDEKIVKVKEMLLDGKVKIERLLKTGGIEF